MPSPHPRLTCMGFSECPPSRKGFVTQHSVSNSRNERRRRGDGRRETSAPIARPPKTKGTRIPKAPEVLTPEPTAPWCSAGIQLCPLLWGAPTPARGRTPTRGRQMGPRGVPPHLGYPGTPPGSGSPGSGKAALPTRRARSRGRGAPQWLRERSGWTPSPRDPPRAAGQCEWSNLLDALRDETEASLALSA